MFKEQMNKLKSLIPKKTEEKEREIKQKKNRKSSRFFSYINNYFNCNK